MGNYTFKRTKYMDNNRLAILAYDNHEESGGMFTVVTTNLEDGLTLEDNMAYIDVNNSFPLGEMLQDKYEEIDVNNSSQLGEMLQDKFEVIGGHRSGFVLYPLVKFDKEFLDSLEEAQN